MRSRPPVRTRLVRTSPATLLALAGLAWMPAAAQQPPVEPAPAADSDTTILAFRNVSMDQVLPFLVEATGKVVLPQPDVLARKITIVNDRPISRRRALDLVVLALQQNGIAFVETEDLVLLRDLAEIDRQDVPVLGPDQSVLGRTDYGSVFEKVFTLRHASAKNVGQIIEGSLPSFAKRFVDEDSNQIIVMGNVALLQRLERLFNSLDTPSIATLETRTFHLRFADAEQIAANIRDLFGAGAAASQQQGGGGQQRNPFQQFLQQGGGGGGQGGRQQQQGGGRGGQQQGGAAATQAAATGQAATSQNLRVTANSQQNSVTVLGEPMILQQIADQIGNSWDLPLPDEAVVPRTYELKNSDPVKVRDLLEGLFGQGTTGTTGSQTSQGVGRLAGQFSFQAIPEASRIVVVAKSPDNLSVIDRIIEDLDKPISAGLPRIIELKHASAEELAEQLNTLLAQEGTFAQLPRQETGLSDRNASASPFAQDADTANAANQTAATTAMRFWWQQARVPTTSAGTSNLVSKLRIVPVWRQNALMVLAPPEYAQSVVDLIEQLDKPGRQVLLSAVIVEISIDDAEAIGLRFSSSTITPNNPDNAFGLTSGSANPTFTGIKNNLLPGLFDTSVLDVGVDLNILLQALSQKTGINVLSEPKIFTSDNQEASFFDGQDIPFITDTQNTDQGNLVQSFDYRAVGIQLRVRPRITPKREVDLRINLELSNILPQQTLFGGFIVDRRETTTHLIVRDGQTVVVSGILRSEDSTIKRKIPFLGDIPLIGGLFSSSEKSKIRTELVAFITPIVVENPEESDLINEQERRRLDELRLQLDPDAVRPRAAAPAAGEAAPAEETPAPAPPPKALLRTPHPYSEW